ncbi:MAG: hypothetical protein HN842_05390 [Gammaproteobacteria bacterium]|jgi:fumarate reductase subunit D|nr:hypothetical protein [Gammaproteobacteria bacterium]MBT7307630.1 hypothetical protein [Gammaproteobacteria bacterium]
MAAKVIVVDSQWPSRFRAMLSYLGIAVFIPLFFYRNDKFIYFHARQGLVLWVITVTAVASLFLPGPGKFLFVVLMAIYAIAGAVGIITALSGSAWELPIIGPIARRYF